MVIPLPEDPSVDDEPEHVRGFGKSIMYPVEFNSTTLLGVYYWFAVTSR